MNQQANRRGAPKAPSQRQLRVGEIVRHALSEILQRGEVNDPVLERVPVTVPEVRMTPDLKRAIAYVAPLGGQAEPEVIEALSRHRRYLRGLVGRRVELKFAPELEFVADDRFDTADEIDRLLRSPEVARDLDGKE